MKKVFIISLMFFVLILSGCSVSQDNSKGTGFLTDSINKKRLEAHDKYLIAKTKEIQTMIELYMMDNSQYPVIQDSEGNPVTVKIYYGSENWNKLKDLILSTPSLQGVNSDISETVSRDQPIEYFSDGSMFIFKAYLTYNKEDYNVSRQSLKCPSQENDFCIFTVSSDDYKTLNIN